jgi:hypothetical protein
MKACINDYCTQINPQPFNNFSRRGMGFRGACKTCRRIYNKLWKRENPERARAANKKSFQKNKDKVRIFTRKWSRKNPEKVAKYSKTWKLKNPDYKRNRRKIDSKFNLIERCRTRLANALKVRGHRKSSSILLHIGCTPQFLIEYIESLFQPGMSWENKSEWQIDHISPFAKACSEEEIYKLCHYTNIQPLWANENRIKRDRSPLEWEIYLSLQNNNTIVEQAAELVECLID